MESIVIIILFLIALLISYYLGYKFGAFRREKHWQLELPTYRQEAIERSRAVLRGQFSEHFAPYLPGFNFNPLDCKFMGKPVDFIVFSGLSKRNIEEVVFIEVKSGNSKLSSIEKNLKKAIQNKHVRWEEYRIPEDKNDI